ncbi:MAG: hypothetical protein SAK29_00920 [Scytonema sp. PMC 1069.18]|nr:hypothetical protein [Scytonema sp. PMC 1069.18]MEC4881784.1 hypothetical protein [Scytonema sp. PMC 1070.18]
MSTHLQAITLWFQQYFLCKPTQLRSLIFHNSSSNQLKSLEQLQTTVEVEG